MLEEIVKTAVNKAVKESQDMVSGAMSKVTGGLNIPVYSKLGLYGTSRKNIKYREFLQLPKLKKKTDDRSYK